MHRQKFTSAVDRTQTIASTVYGYFKTMQMDEVRQINLNSYMQHILSYFIAWATCTLVVSAWHTHPLRSTASLFPAMSARLFSRLAGAKLAHRSFTPMIEDECGSCTAALVGKDRHTGSALVDHLAPRWVEPWSGTGSIFRDPSVRACAEDTRDPALLKY